MVQTVGLIEKRRLQNCGKELAMTSKIKIFSSMLCAAMLVIAPKPSFAGASIMPSELKIQDSAVENVHYKPYYHRHRSNRGVAAGIIGGLIIGGIIANSSRRSARRDRDHVDWCYRRYRSYRISDNSWKPFRGPRRQCRSPYY